MKLDLPGVEQGSDIETLFKAIGFVVIQWGHAEQTLDLMVAAIYGKTDREKLPTKRPMFLSHKTKFLKKWLANIPELQQLQAEGEMLFSRFDDIGKTRNDFIHGAISSLSPPDGAFIFAKLDISKEDGHSLRAVSLSQQDWKELRTELLRLGKDGQCLAQKVWDSLKGQT